MRVHISYTFDISRQYRRAINYYYCKPDLATRDEVKQWLQMHGTASICPKATVRDPK